MTQPSAPQEFDVYCSYAPQDFEAAQALAQTLINKGLQVWWRESRPEQAAADFDAVTTAMARSRLMLAVYTPAYPLDPTCQMELCAAVLSGRREGAAHERLLILTSEDELDHIEPLELRGATAGRIPKPRNVKGLATVTKAVQRRLEEVSGTMGRVQALARPPWHGTIVQRYPQFMGRFSRMWEIHAALQ